MAKIVNFNYVDSDLIDKYIRVNKKEINQFKTGTVGMIDLALNDGIYALVGTTIGDENKAIMSYLFDKNTWTEQMACEWVHTAELTGEIVAKNESGEGLIMKISDLLNSLMNVVSPISSESVYADLKELKGVEIFATGKWNGDMYTLDDLKEMVNSFEPLKATLQPFVKLGHNEKQPLLAKDGLPAAGWIERIYIEGNKLMADIKDMPATIYELIKNKAYKRISSEIYWNLKDSSGKLYKRALKAIALLGGDTPAVGSLADVQALYTKKVVSDLEGDLKTAEVEYFTKGDIMELEKVKAEYEAKLKELTSELSAKNSELAEAVKAKEAAEARVTEFELQTLKSEATKKVDDLIGRKKLLPSQKEYAVNGLLNETKEKKYTDKMFDESNLVKMYELNSEVVDTTEKTKQVDGDAKEFAKVEEIKNAKDYKDAKNAYLKGDQ